MRARREASTGERGAIRSTLLAAAAVVGGNGVVFLLAAAVLIPPRQVVEPLLAPAAPPAAEPVLAPRPVSAPVEAPVPMPGVARVSVSASAPVRVAARTRPKHSGACGGVAQKSAARPIKVARSAAPPARPDGV